MKRFLSIVLSISMLVSLLAGYSIEAFAASAPKATSSASAIINSTSSVTLKWKKATNAKKYIIYKRTNNSSYKKLITVSTTSTTIKSLSKYNTYYFKIQSVSKSGKKGGKTSAITVKTNFAKPSKSKVVLFEIYKYGPGSGVIGGEAIYCSHVNGASGYNIKATYYDKYLGEHTINKNFAGNTLKAYSYGTFGPSVVYVRAYKKDSNKHKIYGPKIKISLYDEGQYISETFYDSFEADDYWGARGYTFY